MKIRILFLAIMFLFSFAFSSCNTDIMISMFSDTPINVEYFPASWASEFSDFLTWKDLDIFPAPECKDAKFQSYNSTIHVEFEISDSEAVKLYNNLKTLSTKTSLLDSNSYFILFNGYVKKAAVSFSFDRHKLTASLTCDFRDFNEYEYPELTLSGEEAVWPAGLTALSVTRTGIVKVVSGSDYCNIFFLDTSGHLFDVYLNSLKNGDFVTHPENSMVFISQKDDISVTIEKTGDLFVIYTINRRVFEVPPNKLP